MTWCWLDLVASPQAGASAQARAFDADDRSVGWFAAWRQRARPTRGARRADARIADAEGTAAWVSLVLPPAGVRLPFDDLAVQQARRHVLARPPLDAVSTLLTDAWHFEGTVTVARGDGVARLADDPFARIFPARLLRVEGGSSAPSRRRAGRRSSATGAHGPGPGTATTHECTP